MSFMQADIEYGDWIEVDGNYGGAVIPADVVGALPDESEFLTDDGDFDEDAYLAACADVVRDYVESTEIYSVSVCKGWGARLSAPGYLDCTDWCVYDTEAEAKRELCELYELCPVCMESVYDEISRDSNPACRFHHTAH